MFEAAAGCLKNFARAHRRQRMRWQRMRSRRIVAWGFALLAMICLLPHAAAEDGGQSGGPASVMQGLAGGPEAWTSPEGMSSTLQVMLLLTVISLAPAILMMTTCFVRIIVVLGLLRQALGTQQLPPSQVITSIALFMTLLVMAPVWKQVYDDAIVPYTNRQISLDQAWQAGVAPVRLFMSKQIHRTGNDDDIWLFLEHMPDAPTPTSYDEVPLLALVPAFMLSELKTAFLIGFQLYLPFLILDMVVASVMVSMGMLMLPPVLISLPFKLLLFVLVDGWRLVIGMLLESFTPI
jgi:flagellar biosynthetic protein FliP